MRLYLSCTLAALSIPCLVTSVTADHPLWGNPQFERQTAWEVAIADLTGDGTADVVTLGRATSAVDDVFMFTGIGNGILTFDRTLNLGNGELGSGLLLRDLDGNGTLDLVSAHGTGVVVRLRTSTGDFGPAATYPTDGYTRGVVAADLDNDGDLDLATPNSISDDISVLLNAGDGSFMLAPSSNVGGSSTSLAAGDLDGDGTVDLVVGRDFDDPGVVLALGVGDGTFRAAKTIQSERSSAVAVEDLDADGDLDVVIDGPGASISVFRNPGNGVLLVEAVLPMPGDTLDFAFGDLNGDGRPEIAAISPDVDVVTIFENTGFENSGDGFGNPVPYEIAEWGWDVELHDMNNDGHLDLVAGGYNEAAGPGQRGFVNVLLNRGDGTLRMDTRRRPPARVSVAVAADVDADAVDDLVATTSNGLGLFRNRGDGALGPLTMINDIADADVTTGDVNGDGHLDLVTEARVLPGLGNGTFDTAIAFDPPASVRFPALGDLDGDGDLDLVLTGGQYNDVIVWLANDGAGCFTVAQTFTDTAALVTLPADIDGDGDIDLVATLPDDDAIALFVNPGDGAFGAPTLMAMGRRPRFVAADDLDGDGDIDLAVSQFLFIENASLLVAYQQVVAVLRNDGAGNFDASELVPFDAPSHIFLYLTSVVTGDFDADGARDIAVTSGRSAAVRVALGDGIGHFEAFVGYGSAPRPTSLSVGRFDADARDDLVATSLSDHDEFGDGTFSLHLSTEPRPCRGDVDANGAVDFHDLVAALSRWNESCVCPSDVSRDGRIDATDVLIILEQWGACR